MQRASMRGATSCVQDRPLPFSSFGTQLADGGDVPFCGDRGGARPLLEPGRDGGDGVSAGIAGIPGSAGSRWAGTAHGDRTRGPGRPGPEPAGCCCRGGESATGGGATATAATGPTAAPFPGTTSATRVSSGRTSATRVSSGRTSATRVSSGTTTSGPGPRPAQPFQS